MTYEKLGRPSRMENKADPDNRSVRFRLAFPRRPKTLEFDLPAPAAMALMRTLQAYHSQFGWNVPKIKPSLVKS